MGNLIGEKLIFLVKVKTKKTPRSIVIIKTEMMTTHVVVSIIEKIRVIIHLIKEKDGRIYLGYLTCINRQ